MAQFPEGVAVNRIGVNPLANDIDERLDVGESKSLTSLANKLVDCIESNIYLNQEAKINFLQSSQEELKVKKDYFGEKTVTESIVRAAVVKREFEKLVRKSKWSWMQAFVKKSFWNSAEWKKLQSLYLNYEAEIVNIHSRWLSAHSIAMCRSPPPFLSYEDFNRLISKTHPNLQTSWHLGDLFIRQPFTYSEGEAHELMKRIAEISK